MTPSPRIELATPADLSAIGALRALVGWQPSLSLLHALVAWDGGRIFVVRATEPGEPGVAVGDVIATTSALAAGPVGVIGNVITHPRFQRRGLGRAALNAALAWQRDAGVRSVWLDATPDGRPLYRSLGFKGLGESWFGRVALDGFEGATHAALLARAKGARARLGSRADLQRLAALDRAAFGGDRLGLLALILAEPGATLYIAEGTAGAPQGYLIARRLEPPFAGLRAGPMIARDGASAAALLAALLDARAPWREAPAPSPNGVAAQLFLATPGAGAAVVELFTSIGIELAVDDLIMRLDFEREPEGRAASATLAAPVAPDDTLVYAWLAPMTF